MTGTTMNATESDKILADIASRLKGRPVKERFVILEAVHDTLRTKLYAVSAKATAERMKPLIGTCWMFTERYAGSSERNHQYNVYYKVVRVEGSHVFYLRFQVNPRGAIEVEPQMISSDFFTRGTSGYNRISQAKFSKAWRRMKRKLEKL